MGVAPVLFVSYSGVLGGAERVLLDCATRLGRPLLLACPPGPLGTAARAAGLAVALLPERPLRLGGLAAPAHLRGLGALARDVDRLARSERPEAIVAWGARAVLAVAAATAGRRDRGRLTRPAVLAVHHDLLSRPAVATALRWATRRAHGVVAASHAVARDLRAGPGAAILHPGVDLAAWTPSPPPPAVPPRALVLGALVPWKRADLALEVAARIPDLQLTVAGAPLPGDPDDYAERLRRRAAQPDLGDRVRLTGALADPRSALAGAHCLLHCADAEPYGLVIVEALASGRPVVAAAAAGPLEILDDHLFAPGDADAAAAALRAALADPAAGAAARARAEARFSVEDSAARFAAALEGVAP